MRTLPPLNPIRTFEVAAAHESFARAAEELHVTRGAVSQQIRQLETFLGTALFERSGRGLALTDAGRRYHEAVGNALNIIERETLRHVTGHGANAITMSVLPAIASLWLVPRLADFQRQHDDVDVQVLAEAAMADLSRGDVHVAIRYGLGETRGCEHVDLGRDRILPVCSPDYRRAHGIETFEDLEGCRLLHDTYWTDDWSHWAAGAGQALPAETTGQYFTHYSLAVDAARASAGALMGHERLIGPCLDSGELVALSPQRVTCREPYFIVYPRRLKVQREVRAFIGWFVEQFG